MKQPITEKLKILDGLEVNIANGLVTVKGPKGIVSKNMFNKSVSIKKEGNDIVLDSKRDTRREKTMFWSFAAHLKNMMHGAKEGYTYKLKICAAHFPITVNVSGAELHIKNFLGESKPRVMKLKQGAAVKIEGEIVTVTGADLEIVSQTAASIEQLTKITNRDRRRFQDGIYITDKDNEKMGGQ